MMSLNTIDSQVAISSLVEDRTKTDITLSNKWLFFPLASLLDWTLLGTLLATDQFAASAGPLLLGLLTIIGLTFSSGTGYIVYVLVNRRNKHFAREKALLITSVENLQSKTSRGDVRTQIQVNSAERDLYAMIQDDHERSAILWGLLSIIPFIGSIFTIVVLQLVSGDYKNHANREGAVIEDITNLGKGAGIQALRSWPISHESAIATSQIMLAIVALLLSFAYSLYLIYLAGGKGVLFAIPLWLSVLALVSTNSAIRSPQTHFDSHRNMDETILRATRE